MTFLTHQSAYQFVLGPAIATIFILLLPLIAMQFTDEVNWNLFDFVVMGAVLFGVGLAYELIARRLSLPTGAAGKTIYRVAFGVGLLGAFLLLWVNGAVGIIGNEGNPANLMYGAVFAVGLTGALISRFKPRGMARTLYAAAVVQMLVPVFALFVWPARASWGDAGVIGVFIFNSIFAILFLISALLFRRASN